MALLGMQFEDGVVQYNLSNNVKIRKKDNIINLYRPYYQSENISFSAAGWQTLTTIPEDCVPATQLAGIVADNNTQDQAKLGLEFRTAYVNGQHVLQIWVFTTVAHYNPVFNITYIN